MTKRSRIWLLGASAIAVGAGCAGEPSLDSVQCSTAADCPQPAAGGCRRSACVSGACGLDVVPAGTPCSDGGGHVCDGDGRCVPEPCTNGILDGEETAVDCGGPTCEPCATGKTCVQSWDCQSGWCEGGVCQKLKAMAIAAGRWFTCAALANGAVKCWGANDLGQLGNGTFDDSSVPVPVAGLSGAVAIAAGGYHSCAVLADGTGRCWGLGQDGQLGDGDSKPSSGVIPVPVPVSGLTGAVAITAGYLHTCALLADGTARCWGSNTAGELGNGGTKSKDVPVPVVGLSGAVAIAAGWDHTCALLVGGTASCWGSNLWGQLGDGTGQKKSPVPVAVAGLSGATSFGAGNFHGCAVLADGTVACWGCMPDDGDYDNCPIEQGTVVPVAGLSDAVALAPGGSHVCALLADGTARCWGWNESGQLGDGSNQSSKGPVGVVGLAGAVSLAAGTQHTCAILGSGGARCWGDHGTLGDGSKQSSNVPVDVAAW